jgi:hypothetical protein
MVSLCFDQHVWRQQPLLLVEIGGTFAKLAEDQDTVIMCAPLPSLSPRARLMCARAQAVAG